MTPAVETARNEPTGFCECMPKGYKNLKNGQFSPNE